MKAEEKVRILLDVYAFSRKTNSRVYYRGINKNKQTYSLTKNIGRGEVWFMAQVKWAAGG